MDMFSFVQPKKEKSIQHHFNEYQQHKNRNANESVSLTQGDKFINYQNKMKAQVTGSNKFNLFSNYGGKEGFTQSDATSNTSTSNTSTSNTSTSQPDASGNTGGSNTSLQSSSTNVLSSTKMSSTDKASLKKLKMEYEMTLKLHQKLQEKIAKTTQQYLKRVNKQTNPYLGKTVSFEGALCYVTNQGVVRYYSNMDLYNNTAGLNGCGTTDWIEMDIPWKSTYAVAGTLIPTDPPMVSGPPMTYGQACGNEGENVYVNMPVDSSSANYVGTFIANTSSPMSFIGGEPSVGIVVQNNSFSDPALSNDTYVYYGSSSSADTSSIPGWTSYGGVIINNSSAWGYPLPYPNGSQACSIQMLNYISQTFSNVETGTYTLTLQACGRNCCDGSGLSNLVDIQLNGTTFYTINIPVNVWTPISTTFTVDTQGTNTITFQGMTDTSNDRSTAIQDLNITLSSATGTGGAYTYDMCSQAAATSGYQYFSLQSGDASGNGYCAVTNDYISATTTGNSYTTDQMTSLWSSNTSGTTGAYAKLTSLGALQVFDSNGTSVFSTPAPTNSSFWGCYVDQAMNGQGRSIPTNGAYGNSNGMCLTNAQSVNALIFGMQDYQNNGTGQCYTGTDSTLARAGGIATNCSNDSSGNVFGGGWSNAMYGAQPGFACFIALQSDGNMCIYRGQGGNDNQGEIWCSNTNGQQQDANPTWVSSTGKYSSGVLDGNNIASNGYNGTTGSDSGFILYSGEYFSDPSGILQLVMQSDGNLVLYTSTVKDNFSTDSNGNYIGGTNANAIYDYGSVPNSNDVGKLAYIDGDGTSHLYPSGDKTILTDTDYTRYPSLQQTGYQYSINGQQSSSMSLADCKTTCTNDSGCGGVTYNASDGTCYYNDSNVSLYSTYPNSTFDTYMKNRQPANPIYSNITNNVSGSKFLTYTSGTTTDAYTGSNDLAAATAKEHKMMKQLETKLNQLAAQMGKSNNQFATNNAAILNQATTNVNSTAKYVKEYKKSEGVIKQQQKIGSNLDGILKDSNIVVLQENYNYAAWSILAVGLVIVSITLVKK